MAISRVCSAPKYRCDGARERMHDGAYANRSALTLAFCVLRAPTAEISRVKDSGASFVCGTDVRKWLALSLPQEC
eukprot:3859601-Pyramimonas_sp.AAC.2